MNGRLMVWQDLVMIGLTGALAGILTGKVVIATVRGFGLKIHHFSPNLGHSFTRVGKMDKCDR